MKRLLCYPFLICLLAACQTTERVNIDPYPVFYDDLYPGYTNVAVETEREVFSLDDEVQAFLDNKLKKIDDPKRRMQALVNSIFDHTDLHLLYMNDANTTASQTFHNRAANCLSLSIMTYAMADYAELFVTFQEVFIPEYWTMREGYSLLNGHVNLLIYPRQEPLRNLVYLSASGLEVDFDRRARRGVFPKETIDKQRVLAMFYNNKGADALVEGDKTKAYAYFRRALELEPEFGSAWVNLGLVYRMSGYLPLAEQSYQQALRIDAEDTSALENMAYVYNLSDRQQQAEGIRDSLKRKRQKNPQYHFILGEQDYSKGNWGKAVEHYQMAIKLDKRKHEFHFALAKAYYQLGDINRSQTYLKRAKRLANDDIIEGRYQTKLDMLSSR